MRRCLDTVIGLLLATPLCAAEPARPNPLTPKEIADGWILLFDGATTFGSKIDGAAKIENGALVLGGEQAASLATTSAFGSFELRLEKSVRGPNQPRITVGGANLVSRDLEKDVLHVTHHSESGRAYPLVFQVPAGATVTLRSIKLRPLGLKPIFNGKDLTGWKVFKGDRYKSKFTVTPEGWLHVENGPGDLQTEDQWDDFILQIDCLCNGDRLNSGVFFRCRPNEYQNGYEAQVHNGFTAEPAKEYTIDEYDPNTHQLIGKKKAKYTAIDYGTGAIYRRIPARFQAAKDHEWFTMTVLAQGNHIATWVNGMQMVDWTDNRPLNDNARNGCKLGKGPISLQGHDPTTDLSFRNIRIAELPK